jgi:uncharacterized delta-60 repeat protein
MHLRSIALGIVLLMAIANPYAQALEGDADPGFGSNGQVTITRPHHSPGNGTRPTGDLVVLADGEYFWAAPLDDGSIWVGRAQRDGTADAAFGSNGAGRILLPACGLSRAVRLVGDDNGGVVVWSSSCLRHVLADGQVDAGFGGGPFPADGFAAADLVRDADGRHVLAGREGQQAVIHRFDPDGHADASFGTHGRVEVVLPSNNAWRDVNALVVRPDGRILAGGQRGNTHGPNLVVVQLDAHGVPDPSWNGAGFVDLTAPAGFNALIANALALDADGSLVVSGFASNGSVSCCVLLTRLDTSGQVDPAFGMHTFQLSGQPSIIPFFEQRDGLALLPNGRMLIGTISFPFAPPFGHRTQYTLIRTFADGSPDSGFGHGGWNSYTIADPDNVGQQGDYNQMHAIGYDRNDDSMLILGRTFFEDNSTGDDYVSLVRARFELIFDAGFER